MIRIKDWMEYQHYKDRNPPWVKLHKKLMTSFEWHCLHNDSKVLALNLWWLASEHDDATSGLVTDNMQKIAFKARMDEKRVVECIRELERHGFIEVERDDSDLLSRCYQLDAPETETETDIKTKNAREKKIGFEDLTVHHIAGWLNEKRAQGKYLTIDEHDLLEMFKDYCRSKNPKYKDYIAAFRNAFKWDNAPKKGESNGKISKQDRLKIAGDKAVSDILGENAGGDRATALPDYSEL